MRIGQACILGNSLRLPNKVNVSSIILSELGGVGGVDQRRDQGREFDGLVRHFYDRAIGPGVDGCTVFHSFQ